MTPRLRCPQTPASPPSPLSHVLSIPASPCLLLSPASPKHPHVSPHIPSVSTSPHLRCPHAPRGPHVLTIPTSPVSSRPYIRSVSTSPMSSPPQCPHVLNVPLSPCPQHPLVPTSPASCPTGATHNWKLSLYLGAQLLFLDLVANFLFLSLRWGPMMLTSMKGRKMPDVCHFRSLAATTVPCGHVRLVGCHHPPTPPTPRTLPCPPFTVTLCSPVPGWVKSSTWMDTSPTGSSTPDPAWPRGQGECQPSVLSPLVPSCPLPAPKTTAVGQVTRGQRGVQHRGQRRLPQRDPMGRWGAATTGDSRGWQQGHCCPLPISGSQTPSPPHPRVPGGDGVGPPWRGTRG